MIKHKAGSLMLPIARFLPKWLSWIRQVSRLMRKHIVYARICADGNLLGMLQWYLPILCSITVVAAAPDSNRIPY